MNITIKNVELDKIAITGIKVNITCKKCFKTWGVYLNDNYQLPVGWDSCSRCKRNNADVEVRYG